MRALFDVVSTVVVTAAAVAMLVVYTLDRSGLEGDERYEEGWEQWVGAFEFGTDDAPMSLDVFMDFTCPHCGRLEPVLDSALNEFPGSIRVRVHHFPLYLGGLSLESAMAAECAVAQGRGHEMYDALFRRQQLIGVESWDSFATVASVPDKPTFLECMQQPPDRFGRILAGRSLGEDIDVRGTPTIWLNGALFDRGRTVAAIRAKAEDLGIMGSH